VIYLAAVREVSEIQRWFPILKVFDSDFMETGFSVDSLHTLAGKHFKPARQLPKASRRESFSDHPRLQ